MIRTPRIEVKLDTTPATFFSRLVEVCETFSIQVAWGDPSADPSDATIVSVRPVTRLAHENLTGAFIRDPSATDRVFAQVHAKPWFPDGRDLQAYITASKRVLGR